MNPLDQIILTGLRATGHHGVLEHERQNGQVFVIDVTVHVPLRAAAETDDLARTIHYGELAAEIVAAVERDPVDLIETVAERVASIVLAHDLAVFVHGDGAQAGGAHRRAVRRCRGADHARTLRPLRTGRIRSMSARPAAGARMQRMRVELPAVLALGSNLGDREQTLRDAVRAIAALDGVSLVRASGIVETPALKPDGVDLDAPAYLNAVVLVRTVLHPRGLLAALHEVEAAHGRVREQHWGDRTLDIDIVSLGGLRVDEPELTVPHPRARERTFVLAPWLEVDPDAVLGGDRVDALLAATRRCAEPVRGRAAVTRTNPLHLVLLAAFGAILLWGIETTLAASGRAVLVPPFTLGVALLLIGVIVVLMALPVRRVARRVPGSTVDPFYATRVVITREGLQPRRRAARRRRTRGRLLPAEPAGAASGRLDHDGVRRGTRCRGTARGRPRGRAHVHHPAG